MITTAALRDAWQADLRDERRVRNEGQPELWAEIAYVRWMLAETEIPVLTVDPERTWVWSDFHLGDRNVATLERGARFTRTGQMNREILRAWHQHVSPGDTVICLGDIAHPAFLEDERNLLDLRACPGERLLILGNHDVNAQEPLERAGFEQQVWGALLDTQPRAALTHLPLKRPPIPAVNIHGHLHRHDEPSTRHFNVSVDRTDYRPVRLDRLLQRRRTPDHPWIP